MGKSRLAAPKSFQLSFNQRVGLVTCKFESRWDMIAALSRAAAHYEKGDINRIRGGFVGINMGWKDFKAWILTLNQDTQLGKRTGATPEEQTFIGYLGKVIQEAYDEPRYIVAYVQDDESTLLHELAHATFYLDESYRNKVSEVWKQVKQPVREVINRCLKEWGYHPDNWLDEWQAYSVENPSVWMGVGKLRSQAQETVQAMELVQQTLRTTVNQLIIKTL